MNNPSFRIFSLLALFFTLLAFSCNSDSCKKTGCGDNGICILGECQCDVGWELDANGQCTIQDLCFNKNCANGTCNDQTGGCDCDPGWQKDISGLCTRQDLCYQVDCGDHGSCNALSGACECDPGYGMDANNQCNYELRGRFIGTWTGSHTDGFGNPSGSYTMTITRDPTDDTKVRFTNFMNLTCTSTTQQAEAVGTIGGDFEEIDFFTFLCADYSSSSVFNSAIMLTDNDFRIEIKVQSGLTIWDFNGVYQRQ